MAAADSKWTMSSSQAHNYIVDPLLAPEPIDETGLNSTFRSTFAPKTPSPNPNSTEANLPKSRPRAPSNPPAPQSPTNRTTRSRGNSLSERYPGDMSHRPLSMIKKDAKTAHHSPHLRKRSIPGVDTIDALDTVPGGGYHHEGPFDATLAARNMKSLTSPVAAVAETNAQALNATPPERIRDAVTQHRPLDGVAVVPPGEVDQNGRVYDYQETNLMTEEGGDQGVWRGLDDKYDPDVERDMQKKDERYETRDGEPTGKGSTSGIEMQGYPGGKESLEIQEDEVDGDYHESSKRHSFGKGLKRRIGSLRRRKD